ncbi:MAG: hypothetical protein V4469_04715 [Patescibacteria group bacterium]
MKKLKVTITEKKKFIHSFNLFNFRDEIVNFMYKKTVANSSRNSMVFYVIVFFLSLKSGSKSLLRDLFDNNIEKLQSLNKELSARKRLKKGEYASLVEKAGLKDILRYDVFFLLMSAIISPQNILSEFKDYFKENPEIEKEFKKIIELYQEKFQAFETRFIKNLIIDDRQDENGEYHDLSKSVNRTIRMRTSRRLDLTLHKHAEVQSVTSQSPVVVQIIQNIHPDIIIQIWESYKLDEYVKEVWKFVNDNSVVAGFVGTVLADKWIKWRSIDGRKNKNAKTIAKIDFDLAKTKSEEDQRQTSLIDSLARSVMSSNEYLQAEVLKLKMELETKQKESSILINREDEIKDLKLRIEKLENINVKVEEIEN